MKLHIFPSFIAILLCTATYAQETFEKNFGGENSTERQSDLKKMKKNGYMVAGYTYSFGAGDYDAYCIRLDNKRQMLWSKAYGTPASESNTTCFGTSDGGFILSFSSYNRETSTANSVFLVRCNESGNIEWSKNITIPKVSDVIPKYVYESKKGDLYLLCDWYSNIRVQTSFTLAKFNAAGKFIWQKSVDAKPWLSSYSSADMFESDNGDIMVAGNGNGDNYNTYGAYTHLFLFDQNTGGIKLSKQIHGTNGGGFIYAYNFTVENDKLNASGFYSKNGYNYNVCWFSVGVNDTKVKANYIAEDNRFFVYSYQYLINRGFIKESEAGFSSYLIFTEDRGAMYAYNSYTIKQVNDTAYLNYNIYLDKYDSLGRICPKFIVPVIDTTIHETTFSFLDKAYSVIKQPVTIVDSSVTVTDVVAQTIVCERLSDYGSDKTGNSLITDVKNKSETKLHLYPNPASDFVNLVFETAKPSDIQFEIITTEGRSLLTKKIFENTGKQQVTLDIRDIPPGLYYIKIIGLNKPTVIKLVKQK